MPLQNPEAPHIVGPFSFFKGSLSDVSPFDLYRQLYLSRQTGQLRLSRGQIVKKIFFRHGSIVFAIQNQDARKLGELLLESNKITSGQVAEIVRRIRSGKRFGAIAVELGILDQPELDRLVRQHQSELAISTLEWKSGHFEFQPGEGSDYEDVYVDLSTADIILEGVRRIDDPAAVRSLLGSDDVMLRFTSDPLLRYQKISLSSEEALLFLQIEGTMSVREICRASSLGRFTAIKALLGLVLTGVLDYATDKTEGDLSTAPPPEIAPKRGDALEPEPLDPGLADDLRTRLAICESSDLYTILDSAPEADGPELLEAYFRLVKRFHPDRYSHSAPLEIVQIGERVFDRITDAYNVLSDTEQRAKYDAGRTAAQGRAESAPVPALRECLTAVAERAFEEGVRLYNNGCYAAAFARLREAVRIDENAHRYRYYLAATLGHLPQRRREAEFHFKLALHQDPRNAEYHFALGLHYREVGLTTRARACFATAFRLNPKLRDSDPELEHAAKRAAGLISKLLRE